MYSQIDIRYKVSNTVADVRSLVHAFPGDVTLCLANHKLYQYVEYTDSDVIPVDDGEFFLQTTNTELLSRWVAVDVFTSACFHGDIELADWVSESGEYIWVFDIVLPMGIKQAKAVFYDMYGYEVYPEDVQYIETDGNITEVIATVGSIPDCRFVGKYQIFF